MHSHTSSIVPLLPSYFVLIEQHVWDALDNGEAPASLGADEAALLKAHLDCKKTASTSMANKSWHMRRNQGLAATLCAVKTLLPSLQTAAVSVIAAAL